MLKLALALCAKDLRIVLARSAGLAQALLLGLLLVFLFSLSLEAGDRLSPQAAATMFWLASAFCQVLVFNMLYSLEEENGSRLGLLTLPVPSQGIWLGKALAGLLLILAAQLVFLPATFVFLGQSAGEEPVPALIGLLPVSYTHLPAMVRIFGGRSMMASCALHPDPPLRGCLKRFHRRRVIVNAFSGKVLPGNRVDGVRETYGFAPVWAATHVAARMPCGGASLKAVAARPSGGQGFAPASASSCRS